MVGRRRHPGRRGRDAAPARRLRQQQTAHARDGDHDRLARPRSTPACAPTPALSDPLHDPAPTPRIFQPLLRSPVGKVARVNQTAVSDFSFRNQLVELKAGSRFQWRFLGTERHDVTLANGPEGLASASVREGSFAFRFRRKGTYNLYCSLHPTLMTQRVVVR